MTQQIATIEQADMFGVLDQNISRVFKATPVTNKSGDRIGTAFGLFKRGEIATAHGLKTGKKDKEQLDSLILKASDGMMSQIKGHVAKLNGEWTAVAARDYTDKNGDQVLSFRLKKVKRSMSDQKLAEAMFPVDQYPTMTLDDKLAAIALMRESQQKQLAGNATDVETETTTAPDNAIDTSKADAPVVS